MQGALTRSASFDSPDLRRCCGLMIFALWYLSILIRFQKDLKLTDPTISPASPEAPPVSFPSALPRFHHVDERIEQIRRIMRPGLASG